MTRSLILTLRFVSTPLRLVIVFFGPTLRLFFPCAIFRVFMSWGFRPSCSSSLFNQPFFSILFVFLRPVQESRSSPEFGNVPGPHTLLFFTPHQIFLSIPCRSLFGKHIFFFRLFPPPYFRLPQELCPISSDYFRFPNCFFFFFFSTYGETPDHFVDSHPPLPPPPSVDS